MDKGEMRNSRVWSFPGFGLGQGWEFLQRCCGSAMLGVGDGAGDVPMLRLLLCPRPKCRIPAVLARSPRSCTGALLLFDVSLISVSIPDLLGALWDNGRCGNGNGRRWNGMGFKVPPSPKPCVILSPELCGVSFSSPCICTFFSHPTAPNSQRFHPNQAPLPLITVLFSCGDFFCCCSCTVLLLSVSNPFY